MKYKLLILFITCSLTSIAKSSIVVFDSQYHSPISGASIISSNGLILGTTDLNGIFSAENNDFPLSVRCLGFETATADAAVDTIFLTDAVYTLPEFSFSKGDRPITRVVTYAREYATGGVNSTESYQGYGEYMLEYFFTDGKVKGYSDNDEKAHPIGVRSISRTKRADGTDTIIVRDENSKMPSLSFASMFAMMPYDCREETDAMRAGADTDLVKGKNGLKHKYSKTSNLFKIESDMLADYKDHKYSPWFFKALGITTDLTKFSRSFLYQRNQSCKYYLTDFIYGEFQFHVLFRGKVFKKLIGVKDDMELDIYIEQYPVEIQHLTIDEYKEMKRTVKERREPVKSSSNALPLPQPIREFLTEVNSSR